MPPPVISRVLIAVGCGIGLLLAACGHQPADDMGWARAALERNAHLEIVATDAQARTFTVRMKDSGELRVIRADQLVGAPTADAPVAASAATAGAESAGGAPPPTARTAAAAQAEPPSPASPAAAAGSAPEGTAAAEPPAAPATAATPVFASRALHAGSPAPPVPGQVLEAGPGYTIEAGSTATAAASGREPGPAGAAERRHDPIVCQGARLLHIDNQNLQFDGDGLSAEDGCEIHITNSRIRAAGVGVSARAANVHIDNSLIEGDAASIDASDGAQIYTASSKFRGLSRQLDTASVHDLGGNVWN
ncbi:MAG TPA: hypothetical protein VNX02_04995 [Steroidobacteraceae bacterium]|jgi:hypothetical protein|nr:hypothetical protein [Steroidobacteraceae bacterium]